MAHSRHRQHRRCRNRTNSPYSQRPPLEPPGKDGQLNHQKKPLQWKLVLLRSNLRKPLHSQCKHLLRSTHFHKHTLHQPFPIHHIHSTLLRSLQLQLRLRCPSHSEHPLLLAGQKASSPVLEMPKPSTALK